MYAFAGDFSISTDSLGMKAVRFLQESWDVNMYVLHCHQVLNVETFVCQDGIPWLTETAKIATFNGDHPLFPK